MPRDYGRSRPQHAWLAEDDPGSLARPRNRQLDGAKRPGRVDVADGPRVDARVGSVGGVEVQRANDRRWGAVTNDAYDGVGGSGPFQSGARLDDAAVREPALTPGEARAAQRQRPAGLPREAPADERVAPRRRRVLRVWLAGSKVDPVELDSKARSSPSARL